MSKKGRGLDKRDSTWVTTKLSSLRDESVGRDVLASDSGGGEVICVTVVGVGDGGRCGFAKQEIFGQGAGDCGSGET